MELSVEVCAGLLQSVPMGAAECVHGYRVIKYFLKFLKNIFGAKKYFKQKVATQAKSQRGLKIIHRLVQSLWSLIQSYLVVYGGA